MRMNNYFLEYARRFFLLCIFTIVLFSIDTMASDVYDVEVTMLKERQDKESMGNKGLVNQAKLYVDGENMWINISMKPINLNGMEGYLGELSVDGRMVSVLDTYDVVDDYNSPDSKDEKMRGKMYPRVLSFPVSLGEEILACGVYVPVMAELGGGNQRARIQISYPEKFEESLKAAKDTKKETENSDNSKFYTVPVALWHFFEDKESMGNGAMDSLANIVEQDGKMTIYIASKKMEVTGITASLINLYYDDGVDFVRATPHAFDLEVEGEPSKRPQVFSLLLKDKTELINVLVDPKVEVMGDEPIKARLKIDFAKMEEVDKDLATVFIQAIEGSPEPSFDASKEALAVNKGVELRAPAGAFSQKYSFYANEIRGDRLKDVKADFDSLDMVYAYEFKALGDLNRVRNDLDTPVNDERESFQPSKEVAITLILKKDGDFKVYDVSDETKEVKYKRDGDKISFNTARLGDFALVYKSLGVDVSAGDKSVNDEKVSKTVDGDTLDKEETGLAVKSQTKSSAVIVTGAKEEESPALIIFFIALMIALLFIGLYFTKKYYREVVRELAYGEELKRELMKKEIARTLAAKGFDMEMAKNLSSENDDSKLAETLASGDKEVGR